MIRCLIVDDEPLAISVIENYLPKVPQLELVGSTTNPLEALDIINTKKVDLIFLDIQMDEMNGIELAKLLPKNTKIIFCTAFSEFAVETYNLEAIDFLLKPIPLPRFIKSVQRASNLILNTHSKITDEVPEDYLFIKTDHKGKMVKINFSDIDYVEGMKNYVAFHSKNHKILSHLSMKEVEEYLPGSHFLRVHKSYIISLRNITAIENNLITLSGAQAKVPLSETYKEIFYNKMKNRLLL